MNKLKAWTSGVALAAVTAVATLGSASPAGATHLRSCREGIERVTHLRATRDVTCLKARRVARRYDHKVVRSEWPSGDPIEARGFDCTADKDGYESYTVRCVRGDKTIRFSWGV